MTKAEKTKQFIIEKTAPLFNKKGYSGTSLSDITEATGLTKGSVYGNFDSKDEVAIAVFEHNLKKLQKSFFIEMDTKKTYREKLMVYPNMYGSFFLELISNGGCPILNTAIEADDTHPILKEKANNAIDSWKSNIIYFLEKGIEAGEFKAENINLEQFALTVIAAIEGAIMITKLSGKINNLNTILSSVKMMIENLE